MALAFVPRRAGDGLKLPWTEQQEGRAWEDVGRRADVYLDSLARGGW